MIKENFLLLFLFFISITAWANCPSLQKVIFKCGGSDTNKHCNWTAPWWEGYQGDAKDGDHPGRFLEAYWGESANPTVGSTNCFYLDIHGHLIELSQNDWGGVPKPEGNLWQDGPWPGPNKAKLGKVCNDSTESCKFDYGN